MNPSDNYKSDFSSIGDGKDIKKTEQGVLLQCTHGLLRLLMRDKHTLRVQATFSNEFKDQPSFVVLPDTKNETIPFEVKETKIGWLLSSPIINVQIKRSPCHITILDLTGNIINQDSTPVGILSNDQSFRISKDLPENEHYYGFGHKGGSLDKRGHRMEMWNQYQMYTPTSDPLSTNIPFFVAIRKGCAYGLFIDSPAKSVFDMGATDPKNYSITVEDSELDYYFFYGPDPKQVLYSYSKLTGFMPLPPRWVLGYHQCRWSYPSEERIRTIANELRTRKIPCDAIWFDIDYLDGYRVFTWNLNAFPDPSALVNDLMNQGFKSVVIIDPGVKEDDEYFVYQEGENKEYFLKKQDGSPYRGTVWPGSAAFPDFLNPAVREWWGNHHIPLLDMGIAAIWNDLNEPQMFFDREYPLLIKTVQFDGQRQYPHSYVHNLFANLMNQATYEAFLRHRPNQRPWILSRAGWAGVQRHAAVWTHDNTSKWEFLQVTVPMLLNLSMSGIPLHGADVGGFYESPSAELFARWMQMSVFTPFCRNHTASGTKDQEPWVFGSEVEDISRRFIAFRYMILPYLYDLTYEASCTGTPIMRPLILEFPHDEFCHHVEDEFLVGSSLLVAPILEEDTKTRELYLPEGEWFDPHTFKTYHGPTSIRIPCPLELIPTLIRRGSIIPFQPIVQYSEEPVEQLDLDIYPSTYTEDSIEYSHYEDDFETLTYQKGNHVTTQYWCHTELDSISLIIQEPEGPYKPEPRDYVLIFRCLSNPPTEIKFNEEPLSQWQTEDELIEQQTGWYWSPSDLTVRVKFPDLRKRMEIHLHK